MATEFSFEALEAPPLSTVGPAAPNDADAVMEAMARAEAETATLREAAQAEGFE